MSARTTSRSTSGPDPAACERTSERWSWARISTGMWRVARAPKPVLTPYDGVSAAASASTTARARSIAASASSARVTRGAVAGDADDVVEGDGADPDLDARRCDWLLCMAPVNARAAEPTRGPRPAGVSDTRQAHSPVRRDTKSARL